MGLCGIVSAYEGRAMERYLAGTTIKTLRKKKRHDVSTERSAFWGCEQDCSAPVITEQLEPERMVVTLCFGKTGDQDRR